MITFLNFVANPHLAVLASKISKIIRKKKAKGRRDEVAR